MNTKLKVLSRLDKSFKAEYIIKRLVEKFPKFVFREDDLKLLKDNIKDTTNYIIFEDYNFSDLFFRCYHSIKNYDYLSVVDDYFSDCEGGYQKVDDLGVIYDVEKDIFVKVEIEIKQKVIKI